ncbi:hypothetical protein ACLOJK_028487 [Asimina triloba]
MSTRVRVHRRSTRLGAPSPSPRPAAMVAGGKLSDGGVAIGIHGIKSQILIFPDNYPQTHCRRGSDRLIGAVQHVGNEVTIPNTARSQPVARPSQQIRRRQLRVDGDIPSASSSHAVQPHLHRRLQQLRVDGDISSATEAAPPRHRSPRSSQPSPSSHASTAMIELITTHLRRRAASPHPAGPPIRSQRPSSMGITPTSGHPHPASRLQPSALSSTRTSTLLPRRQIPSSLSSPKPIFLLVRPAKIRWPRSIHAKHPTIRSLLASTAPICLLLHPPTPRSAVRRSNPTAPPSAVRPAPILATLQAL